MNWITNYVRPKINSLFSRREVPENLWTKCPECGTMLFHRELAENLNVFDFTLDAEDMERIRTLDTGKSTIYDEMDPNMAINIGQVKIHD